MSTLVLRMLLNMRAQTNQLISIMLTQISFLVVLQHESIGVFSISFSRKKL